MLYNTIHGKKWAESESEARAWEASESLRIAIDYACASVNAAVEARIVSGFESSALGDAHTYQSDRDDQLNLVGMVTAGGGGYYKCMNSTSEWAYRPHTAEQLQQVASDGRDYKLMLLQAGESAKVAIRACGTAEEVAAELPAQIVLIAQA